MYDWPELREATDRWGRGLSLHLKAHGFADVPVELTRTGHYQDSWRSPNLLLSQTCGYSFANEFAGRLTAVVTPHYDVEGCEGPNYSSHIMVRAKDGIGELRDLAGRRAAYNNRDSMSGMLALKLVFAPLAKGGTFFGETIESGGHAKSLEALQAGRIDVCAIDSVCVAIARRHRPELVDGIVAIARSPLVPGLPYVTLTSRGEKDIERMRRAVADAFADPALGPARASLFLSGFSLLTPGDYAVMRDLERDMAAGGGLSLWSE